MTTVARFPELVTLLWLARKTNGSSDHVSRLAAKLTEDEIRILRIGLTTVIADEAAFNALFEIFLTSPDTTGDELELNVHRKKQILEYGLERLPSDQLVELASTPVWLAELRDAVIELPLPYWRTLGKSPQPDEIALAWWRGRGSSIHFPSEPGDLSEISEAVAEVRPSSSNGPELSIGASILPGRETPEGVLVAFGPRFPGRVLLQNPGSSALDALRILVKREITDALGLAGGLHPARLTRWATDRLCGPEPLPAAHQHRFFLLVAEVMRDIREEAARVASRSRNHGQTTLAELARDTFLGTVASQESEAAAELARATRKLKDRYPKLGEVLLLHCYAGLPVDQVATLTQQTADAVKEQFADASDWVLAQTV
ncbi:MAG: hypothetical protein K8U57_29785 [Planctomycetes bacterium]|nr:hypothetical protein [Planctomycetota bacterium]